MFTADEEHSQCQGRILWVVWDYKVAAELLAKKKQRLVVVTTERADELNLFEVVHSEVVSLYLIAYTVHMYISTQKMTELTDKVVFHMVIPNKTTWYSEEQLKVQGTWKAGRVKTIVIWDNLSIYMLVLQYTSIYLMVRFWVYFFSLVDSFHRISTQSQFQTLAIIYWYVIVKYNFFYK